MEKVYSMVSIPGTKISKKFDLNPNAQEQSQKSFPML